MKIQVRRSTWVLIAVFVLTLITYFQVRPLPVATQPAYSPPVVQSPARPAPRPKLTTTTVPARPSTSTDSATGSPTSGPTLTPTTSDTSPTSTATSQAQTPATGGPQPTPTGPSSATQRP